MAGVAIINRPVVAAEVRVSVLPLAAAVVVPGRPVVAVVVAAAVLGASEWNWGRRRRASKA